MLPASNFTGLQVKAADLVLERDNGKLEFRVKLLHLSEDVLHNISMSKTVRELRSLIWTVPFN